MFSINQHKRLVEYFTVVGLGSDDFDKTECSGVDENGEINAAQSTWDLEDSLPPQVLDRFPPVNYPDSAFPNGAALFCFPSGIRLEESMKLPMFFSYVLTGASGEHLYGYTLTIFEPATESQVSRAVKHGVAKVPAKQVQLYVPKSLCILSYWPFASNYRTFLTLLYRLSLSNSGVPLEHFISNFVLEIPVPLPNVRVQLRVADTDLVFARPPSNNPISWIDLPFQNVFESLSLENIVQVVTCVLCERPVLLQSSQLSLLAGAAEIFLALIYPFTWTHVYIPVLPENLLMVLQAPLPYLVGVHSSILERAYKANTLVTPDTTVHVDLDSNFISYSRAHPIPVLPDHDTKKLLSRLQGCCPAFVNRAPDWAECVLPFMDSAISQVSRPMEKYDDYLEQAETARQAAHGADTEFRMLDKGECNWIMARTAFFRLLVSLLRDFREFIVEPGTHNHTHKQPAPTPYFDSKGFVNKQKSRERSFYEQLVSAQHFLSFIDDRLHSEGHQLIDMVFFDQSIDAKLNRSIVSKVLPGGKSDTPFLDDPAFEAVKTVVVRGVDPDEFMEQNQSSSCKANSNSDCFPKLNCEWFDNTARSSASRLKSNSVALEPSNMTGIEQQQLLFQKTKYRGKELQVGVATAMACPEEAILASWFVLFCAAVGKETPIAAKAAHVATVEPSSSLLWSPSSPFGGERLFSRTQSLRGSSFNTPLGLKGASSSFRTSTPLCTSDATSGSNLKLQRSRTVSDGIGFESNNSESKLDNTETSGSISITPGRSKQTSESDKTRLREIWMNDLSQSMLQTAFEVADATIECGVQLDEVVFRVLIVACARCGDLDHAIQVLGMMHNSGVRPDSLIFANLVQAFSLNTSNRTLQLSMLNWDHLQDHVREATKRIKASKNKRRFRIGSRNKKSINIKRWDSMSVASNSSQARRPSVFDILTGDSGMKSNTSVLKSAKEQLKGTTSWAFQRLLFGDMSRNSDVNGTQQLDYYSPRGSSVSDSVAHVSLRKTEPQQQPPSSTTNTDTVKAPTSRIESGPHLAGTVRTKRFTKEAKEDKEAKCQLNSSHRSQSSAQHDAGSKMTDKGIPEAAHLNVIIEDEIEVEFIDESNHKNHDKLDDVRRSSSEAEQAHVCNKEGKHVEPNNGATATKKNIELEDNKKTIEVDDEQQETTGVIESNSHLSLNTIETETESDHKEEQDSLFSGTILESIFPGLEVNMEREVCPKCALPISNAEIRAGWNKDPQDYNTTCPSCSKRFVAFFTMSCGTNQAWQGSTGPATPLFCEFLPPWVLVKEVEALLTNKGVEFICSDEFRTSRTTLFWNLMVYFAEFSLPIEFLVGFFAPTTTLQQFSNRGSTCSISPRGTRVLSCSTTRTQASSVVTYDGNNSHVLDLNEQLVEHGREESLESKEDEQYLEPAMRGSKDQLVLESPQPPSTPSTFTIARTFSMNSKADKSELLHQHSRQQSKTVLVPVGSYATPRDLSSALNRRSGEGEELAIRDSPPEGETVPTNIKTKNSKIFLKKGSNILKAFTTRFKKSAGGHK